MTRKRSTAAPHKHLWSYIPRRGAWNYTCAVCGLHSRNDFVQDPAFAEPLVIRSTLLVMDGQPCHISFETDLTLDRTSNP